MRFASFFSGGFITAIVVNPPEIKLAKRTSVEYTVKSQATIIFISLQLVFFNQLFQKIECIHFMYQNIVKSQTEARLF